MPSSLFSAKSCWARIPTRDQVTHRHGHGPGFAEVVEVPDEDHRDSRADTSLLHAPAEGTLSS